jgi:hypothetical protein
MLTFDMMGDIFNIYYNYIFQFLKHIFYQMLGIFEKIKIQIKMPKFFTILSCVLYGTPYLMQHPNGKFRLFSIFDQVSKDSKFALN